MQANSPLISNNYETFIITSPNPTYPLLDPQVPKISIYQRCKNYFSQEKSPQAYLGWGVSLFLIGIGFCSFMIYRAEDTFSLLNSLCKIGCFSFWCSGFICIARYVNKIYK